MRERSELTNEYGRTMSAELAEPTSVICAGWVNLAEVTTKDRR